MRASPEPSKDPLTLALETLHETGADRDPVIREGIARIQAQLVARQSRDALVGMARKLLERALALEEEPLEDLILSNPEVASRRLEEEFESAFLRHQFGPMAEAPAA